MTTSTSWGDASPRRVGTRLRPTAKILPEHARAHNRALVLQYLFHEGPTSRADLARATALTRVTISDLVSVLIAEGLVEELGVRPGQRVGKPAILIGVRTDAFNIVSVDLREDEIIRGAVLTLTGEFVAQQSLETAGRSGEELIDLLTRFLRTLIASATQPVIGVGIGSPGIIDASGRVLEAPNRRWYDVPLAHLLTERLGLPVHVANDANAAALAEFTYGGADGTGLLVLAVGEGVGAGIMVDGIRLHGKADAAGELGHVTAVDDGEMCACGRRGCLETILSVPALRRRIEGLSRADAATELAAVGRVLGAALAPVVSALDLAEVLLAGPADLLDGPLRTAADEALRERCMPVIANGLRVRMASLDDRVVLTGAAVLVLSGQLGIS